MRACMCMQVAESAGFPASVVQLAREKLAQLEGAEVISVKVVCHWC